jgi:RimJ/RimL family protein N-acetyltransferase
MIENIRKKYFPMKLSNGVIAQSMDRKTALKTIELFNERIFPPGFKEETGAFRPPKARMQRVTRLWEQRIDTHPEWIVFFDQDDDPIGWFYGYMEDEQTFFIDTIGLVPEVRAKGIYQAFLRKLITYLKAAGYERLTSSHHPNNRAVLIPELKVGFNIVGLEINESAGPILRVAHPLHEDRRVGFERVFCMMPEDSWRGKIPEDHSQPISPPSHHR